MLKVESELILLDVISGGLKFNPRRVPIWGFFDVDHENEVATCRTCFQTFTNKKEWGTICVKRHLKKHPEVDKYAEALKRQWLEIKRKEMDMFLMKI